MRIPSTVSAGEVGFNMTPIIDVVFLLIIFFLVSSHLAKQEAQLELPLPVADSGKTPVESTSPRVTINVLADGSLTLAGRSASVDELKQRLVQRIEQDGLDLEVRIRTDQAVAYRDFEPIMLACAEAGVWNVNIAVHRRIDVGDSR